MLRLAVYEYGKVQGYVASMNVQGCFTQVQ